MYFLQQVQKETLENLHFPNSLANDLVLLNMYRTYKKTITIK